MGSSPSPLSNQISQSCFPSAAVLIPALSVPRTWCSMFGKDGECREGIEAEHHHYNSQTTLMCLMIFKEAKKDEVRLLSKYECHWL